MPCRSLGTGKTVGYTERRYTMYAPLSSRLPMLIKFACAWTIFAALTVSVYPESGASKPSATADTSAAPSGNLERNNPSSSFKQWGYGNEILGAGHLWSFVGTYRFTEYWGATTGFSYILIPGSKYNADYFILPTTLSYFLGGFGHGVEILAGALVVIPAEMGYRTADRSGHRASATSNWVTPITGIGYSYRPKDEGWFIRINLYGVIGWDPKLDQWGIRPWPGLSVGRVF